MVDLKVLATYPFLPEAQEWVKGRGPSLDELLKDRAYSSARALGKKRLMKALEKDRVWSSRYDTEPESINELLSYIVARILASVVCDSYLIRRYVLGEAERVNKMLQDEGLDFVVKVCRYLGIEVSTDLMGVPVPGANGDEQVRIHFLPFLTYTSQMRSQKWKLVNMDIKEGFVLLEKGKVCRIVQEVLRRKFEDELPLGITGGIKDAFEAETLEIMEAIKESKKHFEPEGFGRVRAECFPPCVKKLLAQAQGGENISHNGRFTMATFLHTVGMGNEEILTLFANSPDFREDIARYQVDHVTGVTSATEYTPPECTTLMTYGLCVDKDNLCHYEWLTHPLKYYRTKCKPRRRKEPASKGAEDKARKGPEEG